MPVTPLDYEAQRRSGISAIWWVRLGIVMFGIVMPYLARIPGAIVHGADWLTSYFGSGLSAIVFVGLFNSLTWIGVVAAGIGCRTIAGVVLTSLAGFALPAYLHGTLNLGADAQAGIAIIFIPIYTLPAVVISGLMGWGVDSWVCRRMGKRDG